MKPRNLTILLIAALVLLALAFLSGLAVGLTLWVPTETELAARRRLRAQRAAAMLDAEQPASSGPYVLQAGAFADPANARRLTAELQHRGYATRILQIGSWHVVQTGRFRDAASASRAASEFTVRERLTAVVRRAEGL